VVCAPSSCNPTSDHSIIVLDNWMLAHWQHRNITVSMEIQFWFSVFIADANDVSNNSLNRLFCGQHMCRHWL